MPHPLRGDAVPHTRLLSTTPFYIAMAVCMLASLGALAFAALAYIYSRRGNITARTLTLRPEPGDSTGISILTDGTSTQYHDSFAALRISMPKQVASHSTSQSGIVITNGQNGVVASGQHSAAFATSGLPLGAFVVNGDDVTEDQLLARNGVSA